MNRSKLLLIGLITTLTLSIPAEAKLSGKNLLLGGIVGGTVGYLIGKSGEQQQAPQQQVTPVPVAPAHDVIMCRSLDGLMCRNPKGNDWTVYQFAGKAGYKYIHRRVVTNSGGYLYIQMEVSN